MRHIVNALFVRDGNVLLARRSPRRAAYAGLWSFPGGHQEAGETLGGALHREVREEVGVIPLTFGLLGTIDDPTADNTDPATYHMYAVTAWDGGEPALVSDEHTELRWFTSEEVTVLPDLALVEYGALIAGALRAQQSRGPRHRGALSVPTGVQPRTSTGVAQR